MENLLLSSVPILKHITVAFSLFATHENTAFGVQSMK